MFWILIGILILQRLGELVLAHRNLSILKQRGGYEVGASHYKYIVFIHLGWFISMIGEYYLWGTLSSLWFIYVGIFIFAQIGRYWVISTLGIFWNTRIVVIPNTLPIKNGPYRFLRHPNYLIVKVELLVFPLIFNLFFTAIVFAVLNYFILKIRITEEEKVLSKIR